MKAVNIKWYMIRKVYGLVKCKNMVKGLKEVVVMAGDMDNDNNIPRGGQGGGGIKGKILVKI